jgi:hypothetical protein
MEENIVISIEGASGFRASLKGELSISYENLLTLIGDEDIKDDTNLELDEEDNDEEDDEYLTISADITDEIRQFFVDEDEGEIHLVFKGNNSRYDCYTETCDKSKTFLVYSYMRYKILPKKRQNIAEYLTRANFELTCGNFEMNFSDGEVRYRTSINIEDGNLTNDMIAQLLYGNIESMDRYYPGIMSIVNSEISPEDALHQIINSSNKLVIF